MFDLDLFIADCRAALEEHSPQLAIKELTGRAVSQPSDVAAALGPAACAEIVALHRSPELTILKVLWAPGMAIYPHDHGTWAVIGLYGGAEDNAFFRRSPDGLDRASGRVLKRGESALLGDQVIHAVSNPGREFASAIHVYGGDFFAIPRKEWDPLTLEERPYDMENALRVFREANERGDTEVGG